MTDQTESNVTATLEAIIGRVPETEVLLDQLVGVRFESSPTEVTITCRPDAAPTQVSDGPLPVRALVTNASGSDHGRDPACGWRTATSRRPNTPGTPTIRPWRWPAAAQLVFG